MGKPQKQKQKNRIDMGDFCLLNVAKYAGEWPQIGKVVEILQTNVVIQWMKGSKLGPWSLCTVPEPGVRGKRVPWTEKVKPEEIWHSGFTFTNANKLPIRVRDLIDNFQDF